MSDPKPRTSLYTSRSDPGVQITVLGVEENSVSYQFIGNPEARFQIGKASFDRKFSVDLGSSLPPQTDHKFRLETLIDAPLGKVFVFFSRAENLEKLTPSNLRFEILGAQPIEMRNGALIRYKLSLYGVKFKWLTRIEMWNPPVRFVDNQLSGPYKVWWHQHTFSEAGGKTLMVDEVHYSIPGWLLEPIIHRLFVGPQISEIFRFRTEAIQKIFG